MLSTRSPDRAPLGLTDMPSPAASLAQRVASAALALGVLASALLLLALLDPSPAFASSSLVFSSPELTTLGLRPAPTSAASARAQLVAGLPGPVDASLDGALIQASAASAGGQLLDSYAFVPRSSLGAGRILTSWRSAHHATAVAIGAGGAVAVAASTKRTVVQVLWRSGARLGLVVLTETRNLSTARNSAISYAMLAQSYLSTALPTTALGKVIAEIRPNGTVSMTTALQAFALTFGSLPGVQVPSGGKTSPEPSGDLAAAWVLPYLPHLSQPLQRAVYRDLGLTPPGASARTASYGDPGFTPDDSLTAAANHWAAVYSDPGDLNHTLSLKIVAGRTMTDLPGAAADAYPVDASGKLAPAGPYCRIRIAKTTPVSNVPHVLAHEVFHCEEFDLDQHWSTAGAWVIEGMAEWAAQTETPNGSYLFMLNQYVGSSETNLFARAYDGEGFWGHVQDTVPGGLWPRIAAVLNAPGPEARYAAAGGDTDAFLTTWGSSVFNLPAHAPAWDMVSPVPVSAQAVFDTIDAGVGATVLAAPYTTSQYVVDNTDPTATLLHVQISGYARLGQTDNYTDLHDAWFCTSGPGTCVCPSGTAGEVPPSAPLPMPGATLGLAADPANSHLGARGTVVAVSLDTFCKPQQSSPGPPTGTTGLLPAESCIGLFSASDFPGATTENTSTLGVLTSCVYGETTEPPIVGAVSVATLSSAAEAQTYFMRQASNCAGGCAPIQGIGDEAQGGVVTEMDQGKSFPGWEGFVRVDNVILSVATFPGNAGGVEALMSRAAAEIVADG